MFHFLHKCRLLFVYTIYIHMYLLLKIHALNLGKTTLYRVEENEYTWTVKEMEHENAKTGTERISSFCYAKAYTPRKGIVCSRYVSTARRFNWFSFLNLKYMRGSVCWKYNWIFVCMYIFLALCVVKSMCDRFPYLLVGIEA